MCKSSITLPSDRGRRLGFALLMAGLMLLEGCGFQPQYAFKEREVFDHVEVPIIKDRYGQILRNSLLNFIGQPHYTKQSQYIYEVNLEVTHRDLGFEKNLNVSRAEVLLVAKYHFWPRGQKHKAVQGMCRTSEYYSLSKTQIFQNVSVERSMPVKGLEILSRCLVDRLVILLKDQKTEERKKT